MHCGKPVLQPLDVSLKHLIPEGSLLEDVSSFQGLVKRDGPQVLCAVSHYWT